jgi:hypothetical protein
MYADLCKVLFYKTNLKNSVFLESYFKYKVVNII